MVIGLMKEEEIPAVAAILRACFECLADQEGFNERQRAFLVDERASEEAVRAESRLRSHLVARDKGEVLGMAVIDGNRLARLYVDPRIHRRGVGRALFDAAEAMIGAQGRAEMTVGAWVDSSVAFYQSMGMKIVGQTEYEPNLFPDRKVTLLAKPVLGV